MLMLMPTIALATSSLGPPYQPADLFPLVIRQQGGLASGRNVATINTININHHRHPHHLSTSTYHLCEDNLREGNVHHKRQLVKPDVSSSSNFGQRRISRDIGLT
jgi:hypothetical protein